jgi:HK97 family phage portal protein
MALRFPWSKKNPIEDEKGQLHDYIEILTEDLAQLNASKFAIQKCVAMIANAISKSEIVIQGKKGLEYNSTYYRLNIKPNDNETGTEFWARVTEKLLIENEALVVFTRNMFYLADSWTVSNDIMRPKTYTGINLVGPDGTTYQINKHFKSDEVMHLRLPENNKRLEFFKTVAKLYDKTTATISTVVQLSNVPKFGININTQARLVEKTDTGDKVVTGKEYASRIIKMLCSDKIEGMALPEGIKIESLNAGGSSNVDAAKIDALVKASEEACARAFDIPKAVYFGEISDQSDATNEFITYAVSPVAECLNDGLNNLIVGEEDYIERNERIIVFLARFKHIDIIDSADKLSKMRGDGWTLDEIFHLIGYPEMHSDFTTTRALTKNYATSEDAAE